MALTNEELKYFEDIVKKVKYSVHVLIPIEPMDHENRKGRSKDALGTCWATKNEQFGFMEPCKITIDEYFIKECYLSLSKPYMKIIPDTIESVIAHEIAHMRYWRHGKKHTEWTEYILKLIESGKPHGICA